jgi:phage/plasmid-associated DNA primase
MELYSGYKAEQDNLPDFFAPQCILTEDSCKKMEAMQYRTSLYPS